MRRDLDLDFDPAELVLSPPDRSQLKEMFRRFEFRNLLSRVDELDEALPAAASLVPTGVEVPWREELSNSLFLGRAASASPPTTTGSRSRTARRSSSRRGPRGSRASSSRTTPSRCAVEARDDTMILAYLIEPGRAEYELDDLAAEYGIELAAGAGGRGGDGRSRTPRRRHAAAARAALGAFASAAPSALPEIELPLPWCSRRWRTRESRSTRTGWARSPPGSPTASRSSRRKRTSWRARSS